MQSLILLYFGSFLFCSTLIYAFPTGFCPITEEVKYVQNDSLSHIIHTNGNAIIQWDQFSLSAQESLYFSQDHVQSAVLNRVIGHFPSHIDGKITSNGKIFLINPAGIVIGPSGIIQASGFYASTANLPNEDFLEKKELHFTDLGEGSIVHLGVIESPFGEVVLLSRNISHVGSIEAHQVTLVSGAEVLLKPEGPFFIQSTIESCQEVNNPYELAINSSGSIHSQTIDHQGGKICLVTDKGSTKLSGKIITKGGEVQILGSDVVVEGGALIDVSSDFDAGTVLIGGDLGGKNPDIQNAKQTSVLEGSTIHADSFVSGDGGKIIMWSDTITLCEGDITAKAYGEKGDGGFVEVSGREGFIKPAHPDLRSVHGKAGTLLLDPGALTIQAGVSVGPPTYGTDTISADLALGNVTIDTASGTVGDQVITMTGGTISWSTSNTLSLIAVDSIALQAGSIQSTNAVDTFTAIQITTTGGTNNYVGIGLTGTTLSSASGDIILNGTGGTGSANHGVWFNGGTITGSNGANISVTGVGGTINGFTQGGAGFQMEVIPALLAIASADGDITIMGTGGGGTSFFNVGVNISQRIEVTGTGTITVTGAGGANGTNSEIGVQMASGTTITTSGNIDLTGTGGGGATSPTCYGLSLPSTTVTTTSGNVIMDGTGGNTSTQDVQRGLVITSANITTGSGSVSCTGTGGINSGNISDGILGVSCFITSTSGNLTFDGTAKGTTGQNRGVILSSVTLSTDGTIDITGVGGGTLGTLNDGILLTGGTSISNMNQAISMMGTGGDGTNSNPGINITGSTTIVASDGNINLTGQGGGSVDSNHGVVLSAAAQLSSTAGLITFNGTGGTAATCYGVLITGLNTTVSGQIDMTGVGGAGAGANNTGILINNAAQISNTTNLVSTLMGTGGNGTDNSIGVHIVDATTSVSTGTANLSITGIGGAAATGNNNRGVFIEISATVSSGAGDLTINGTASTAAIGTTEQGIAITSSADVQTTSGSLQMTGTGGPAGSTDNYGILVTGSGTTVSTTSGNMTFTGNGGGVASSNSGIVLSSAGSVSSTSGLITFNGTAGTGAFGTSYGVFITGASTSLAGRQSITGQGNGSNANNIGIFASAGAQITNTTALASTWMGTGGNGTDNCYGISILGGTTLVSTGTADINMTGIGGVSASGTNNHGIIIDSSGTVNSGSGNLTLNGTASTGAIGLAQEGVVITGDSVVQATSGTLSITGVGGTAGSGSDNGVAVLGGGNVTTTSGTLEITGTAGGGVNSNIGIFVSGTGLMASEVSTDSGSITFMGTGGGTGASNSGIVLSSSGVVMSTSGLITFDGTAGTSATTTSHGVLIDGINTSLDGRQSITGQGNGSGAINTGITASGGALITNTTAFATTWQGTGGNGAGSCIGVSVTGPTTSISTGTANLSITGQGGITASGISNQGISVDSTATISSGSGNLTMTGTAGPAATSATQIGILIVSGSDIQTTSGTLQLIGTGGALGSTQNYGVSIGGIGTTVTATSGGAIQITGTGRGTGNLNVGCNIATFSQVSSSGLITVNGTGSTDGQDTCYGILVDSATVSGPITFSGTGNGSGDQNTGVRIANSASLANTTATTSSISGTGGASGTNSRGIHVLDSGTTISSTNSGLTMFGTKGASATDGILLDNATISSGVSVTGQTFSNLVVSGGTTISAPSISLTALTDLIVQDTNTAITSTGNMLLIAGVNITLENAVAPSPTITAGGDMTFVVDNQFPTFPGTGTGGFSIASDVIVTATGEFRIYTVSPALNTISAPLNGQVYIPGQFGVNTATEQWGVYYAGGTYGGESFNLYYKIGGSVIFDITKVKLDRMISQLTNLLPVIQFGQLSSPGFDRPSVYHAHFCPCRRPFAPYRAFIFEDDIFWMNSPLYLKEKQIPNELEDMSDVLEHLYHLIGA